MNSSYLPSYVFAGDMAAMSASPSADLSPLAAMAAREYHPVVTSAPPTTTTAAAPAKTSSWLTTPLVAVEKKTTPTPSRKASLVGAALDQHGQQKQQPGWLAKRLGATITWNKPAEDTDQGEVKVDIDEHFTTLNTAVGRMTASFRDINAVAPSNF